MNSVEQYQAEIGSRAQQPSDNPSLAFDSSMTKEQMRVKFKKLRDNARARAFA
jgi:hypothetical protein